MLYILLKVILDICIVIYLHRKPDLDLTGFA